MKLLHITATHLNPNGGIPYVLNNLSRFQNKISGLEVKVLSLCAKVDHIENQSFIHLGKSKVTNFIEHFSPDIVILHSFFYLEYNFVVRYLHRNNIPYFIEPHGSFNKNAMKKSFIKKFIANRTIFRNQIRKATGYIFLNKGEMENSIYRTKNDIIINNGVLTNEINFQILPNNSSIDFYYIGRYDYKPKGIDKLLLALEILDRLEYKFVFQMWGTGNKKDFNKIQSKIKNFKNIRVIVNNGLYGAEKNILEQIGPMLLASRMEGFPMTVLEALAYGNPCALSKETNLSEVVEQNEVGWILSDNPQEIAQQLIQIHNQYNIEKNSYIIKCKKFVSSKFDWSQIAIESHIHLNNFLKQNRRVL